MAQVTELGVMALPGMVHTFTAKTEASGSSGTTIGWRTPGSSPGWMTPGTSPGWQTPGESPGWTAP